MKITVEAKDHKNYSKLEEYCKRILTEKYEDYGFINTIKVSVRKDSDSRFKTSLGVNTKHGSKLFASAIDENEYNSFRDAIAKMDSQVSKQKTKHYQGIHKS